MSRFILVTKEIYPMLLSGFTSGADMLSAANPDNNNRDLRPGKNGGTIAREERAISRALLSLSRERELTDEELDEYGLAFFREHGIAPSLKDIEKLIKPRELHSDPIWLELNESEWERLTLYFFNAKWLIRVSNLAADILDLLEASPTSKLVEMTEKEYGNHT